MGIIKLKRHVLIGLGASVLLMGLYLGIITLAQDWTHALEQTAKWWYWMLALSAGFGIQSGLFSFVRHSLRRHKAASTAQVAISGGVSAGSMAACCAHHLADFLPLLGLSAVTAFLVDYQLAFIIVGVVANMAGIAIMVNAIRRHNLCFNAGQSSLAKTSFSEAK